jgi:hypothetical protein
MITRPEVINSLFGAWRLLLRDPRGMEYLDDTIDGYWKSFFCAVIVLPGYALWFFFTVYNVNFDAGLFRILIVEGIGYVIGWVAWPLLMAYIAKALDRDRNYIRYIVAYNWSAGISILIYLVVLVLRLLGFMPIGIMAFVSFIALVVILSYHWYILRVGLEVSPAAAAGLVAGDFVLGQIISGFSRGMLH